MNKKKDGKGQSKRGNIVSEFLMVGIYTGFIQIAWHTKIIQCFLSFSIFFSFKTNQSHCLFSTFSFRILYAILFNLYSLCMNICNDDNGNGMYSTSLNDLLFAGHLLIYSVATKWKNRGLLIQCICIYKHFVVISRLVHFEKLKQIAISVMCAVWCKLFNEVTCCYRDIQ